MSTGPDVQTDPLAVADVDEQAALWFARCQNRPMPSTQRQALDAWLARSAQHRHAFESMFTLWRDAAELPRPALASRPAAQRFSWGFRPLKHLAAGLLMLFALVLPYSQWPVLLQDNMTVATTDQPKTLQLSDGSRIMLNRDSRLRIVYQHDQRLLWLEAGEAYFSVSPDSQRPFYVEVDGRQVKVVGTAFDIRKAGERVSVAVSQGVVAVTTALNAPQTLLHAGDSATSYSRGDRLTVNPIDLAAVGEWRFGQLSFDNQPLREVLATLKPYYAVNVTLSDAALGNLPLSGQVNLDDPTAFFNALPLLLPVNVVWQDKNNLLINKEKKK